MLPTPPSFRLRRLHRQRRPRRAHRAVLNQEELAELLGCNQQSVADALTKLGLRYHRDSGEQIFSSLGEEDLSRIAEFVADGSQARGLDTPVDNPARQSSVTVRPNNPSGRHPGESDTDANT